jgi:hypothetical protein
MTSDNRGNYVEYYLCKPCIDENDNKFDTSLSQEDFLKAFDYLVKTRRLRYHEYQVRETVVNNVLVRHTMEPGTQKVDQIKQQVYLLNLCERATIQPIARNALAFLKLSFKRETAPAHNVPSSQNIFKDVFIQYASVRLSKQIFINFEKQYKPCVAQTFVNKKSTHDTQPQPCTYVVKIVVWNYPVLEEQERGIHTVMLGLMESISESEKTIGM